jgi:hypothetical protein
MSLSKTNGKVIENKISYSKLLIDFIDPLLTGQEDETELLSKLTLGQIAWNFSVSDLNDLPLDNRHKESFIKITQYDSKLKEILNQLVLRRAAKYSQHNQFIFKVEIREKKFGEKVVYVEAMPGDKIGKII